jgi:hypothetical protein
LPPLLLLPMLLPMLPMKVLLLFPLRCRLSFFALVLLFMQQGKQPTHEQQQQQQLLRFGYGEHQGDEEEGAPSAVAECNVCQAVAVPARPGCNHYSANANGSPLAPTTGLGQ